MPTAGHPHALHAQDLVDSLVEEQWRSVLRRWDAGAGQAARCRPGRVFNQALSPVVRADPGPGAADVTAVPPRPA